MAVVVIDIEITVGLPRTPESERFRFCLKAGAMTDPGSADQVPC